MKIAYSADSAIDLTSEQAKEFSVSIVPFKVLLGDKDCYDGEVSGKDIIEYVNKSGILPKTSAVNEEDFNKHFSELLTENDAVIHFSLSSELSGAYNNAVNSAKNFKNVYVIDSRSLSSGIALLLYYTKRLIESGKDIKDAVNKANAFVDKVHASFVLTRLDYLYKGGRCNSLMYFGANILKIKPQILLKGGKMITGKRFRGNYDKAVYSYKDDILENMQNADKSLVFVTFTTAEEAVVEKIIEDLKAVGFQKIVICHANAVITSHCGEKCLGILYMEQ